MGSEITTPCIGVCSTIYGDDICRGCHRSFDEIIEWNSMSSEKKESILDRLENLQIKHSKKYLHVFDKNLLIAKLQELNLRFRKNCNEVSLAYQLLRQHMDKINTNNLKELGVEINEKTNSSVNNLLTNIDEKIYNESEDLFYKNQILKAGEKIE